MKATRILVAWFLVLVLLCTHLVSAAGQSTTTSGPIAKPSGEANIVRVYYPDLAAGNQVLLAFEPWLLETNYEQNYHVMQVTQEEVDRLEALGLRVEPDDTYVAPRVVAPEASIQTIPGYSCYRTVEETFASAQALATNYPTLATWTDAGNTWLKSVNQGGYDLMVLKLTNSATGGDKPKLFVTAAIHAREYATAELVMRFGEYLVNNYGTDPDATWILDHHEVHLMLQTNPDGRKKAETGLSWRKNLNNNYCANTNSRGADLNRNFSFQWACCGGSSSSPCDETYHGASAGSEPETQAVQNYLDSIFPDQRGPNLTDPAPADATGIYLDIHSYGRLVLWPWGFTSSAPPNSTTLRTLGRKFAYFNSHTPQQAYALYATDGTTDDHAYGKLGVASYCFETGTAFFQSCTYFTGTLLPANLPALIYAAKVVRTPYMTPAGPDAVTPALSASEVPAGTSVTLSATINDTRYNNTNGTEPTQNIAAAEYYVDVPPWNSGTPYAMPATDGSFNSTAEGVTASVNTTGWSTGKHILFVRGKDASNNWGAFSAIFLTVTGPANQAPTADPQPVSTAEDTAVAITLTGSDPENDPLTFSVATNPAQGTLSGTAPNLTYTPAANYNGPDSFTFVANDGHSNSAPATVSITITPVNDAPVATPQSVSTQQDTALAITLSGTDVDGDALTFAVATPPASGTLGGDPPNLTYTPQAGYIGTESFTFTANDGQATSVAATVSIEVVRINHPPVANAQSVTTAEDTAVAINLTGSDPDLDPLTFAVQTQPAHGTLSGTAPNLTYTPAANHNGPDSFTFVVDDGQATSDPAALSITVSAVNDAPAANPQSISTQQDTALAITLTGSDVDGDGLAFAVVANPAHGTLSGTAPNLTYTPNVGYSGSDSFTFKANDGAADSNVATVSITVTPAGDTVWLSLSANATLPNVGTVNDEDIVALNLGTGVYSWVFDGSDLGITGDIDAFDVLPNGHILMSFDGNTSVTGLGTVADADVVEFTPTALGATTAGTFAWKLDGSDVGLSSNTEDIDALYMMGDGTMVVSFRDTFSVTGASGQDEDLIRFTATSWGSTTAGTWSWYFDGSDVGLSTSSGEDVDALWVDQAITPYPDIYLCTLGDFSVTGVSGANEDVFVFHPTALGSSTTGSFGPGLYFDGSLFSLSSYDVDAFDVQR